MPCSIANSTGSELPKFTCAMLLSYNFLMALMIMLGSPMASRTWNTKFLATLGKAARWSKKTIAPSSGSSTLAATALDSIAKTASWMRRPLTNPLCSLETVVDAIEAKHESKSFATSFCEVLLSESGLVVAGILTTCS